MKAEKKVLKVDIKQTRAWIPSRERQTNRMSSGHEEMDAQWAQSHPYLWSISLTLSSYLSILPYTSTLGHLEATQSDSPLLSELVSVADIEVAYPQYPFPPLPSFFPLEHLFCCIVSLPCVLGEVDTALLVLPDGSKQWLSPFLLAVTGNQFWTIKCEENFQGSFWERFTCSWE